MMCSFPCLHGYSCLHRLLRVVLGRAARRSLSRAANSRSRIAEASPRVSVSHPAMPKRLRKPGLFAKRVDRKTSPPGIPIHQHDLVLVGGEPPGLPLRVFLRPSEWCVGQPALPSKGRCELSPDVIAFIPRRFRDDEDAVLALADLQLKGV